MNYFKLTTTIFLATLGHYCTAQTYNAKLAQELTEIYRNDQQFRKAAIQAAKKYGLGSKQDQYLMSQQTAADLKNLVRIEQLIGHYGYPGKSLVGADLSKVAFMVVQHNDLDAQQKYLPLFEQAAAQGQLDSVLLPLMIDRVLTAKNQEQRFGTQLIEVGQQVKLYPILEEMNVDQRRKKYGLPPLAKYLKQWQIDYQLPTSEGNPNPKDLYFNYASRKANTVEAIGGDQAIINRVVYPPQAKAAQIKGDVLIEFTIDEDGSTKEISVAKGLGYGCDEEAVRVIKTAKFTNATGTEVSRRMKIPFGSPR